MDGHAKPDSSAVRNTKGRGSQASQLNAQIIILMPALRKLDDEAWETFVEITWKYYMSVAYSLTSDGDDSTEIVQEMMSKLVANIAKYRQSESGFMTWSVAILTNIWVDKMRRRARFSEYSLEEIESISLVSSRENPHEIIQQNEANIQTKAESKNWFKKLSKVLKPDQLKLLYRKYVQNLSSADIAYEDGTSEDAVNSKLWRVKQKGKDKTEDYRN